MVGESASLHHFHRFELLEACLLCDLVLALVGVVLKVSYVCDVAYVAHLVSQVLEQFHEYVICYAGSCMSEVCVAVDCRAADVKSDMPFVDRLEYLLLS